VELVHRAFRRRSVHGDDAEVVATGCGAIGSANGPPPPRPTSVSTGRLPSRSLPRGSFGHGVADSAGSAPSLSGLSRTTLRERSCRRSSHAATFFSSTTRSSSSAELIATAFAFSALRRMTSRSSAAIFSLSASRLSAQPPRATAAATKSGPPKETPFVRVANFIGIGLHHS
jgi:hypothetical protein